MLRDGGKHVISVAAIESGLQDEDIQHIVQLSTVQELYLSGNDISASALADLERLPALKSLYLTGIDLSDDGLKYVRGLDQLVVLDLRATGVTDDALLHFHGLANLRFLDLAGTEVTDAGLRDLSKMHPHLDVNTDSTDQRYIKW